LSLVIRLLALCLVVSCIWTPAWSSYPSPVDVASAVSKGYKGFLSFKSEITFAPPFDKWKIIYWQEQDRRRIEFLHQDKNATLYLLTIDKKGAGYIYPVIGRLPQMFYSLKDFVSPYVGWREMGIDLSREKYQFFEHRPVIVFGDGPLSASIFIDIEQMVPLKKTYPGGREVIFRDFVDEGNYLLPSSFEIDIPGSQPLMGRISWISINEKFPPDTFSLPSSLNIPPLTSTLYGELMTLLRYFSLEPK